jgi:hypothetical protein
MGYMKRNQKERQADFQPGIALGFVIGWGNLNGFVLTSLEQPPNTDNPQYRFIQYLSLGRRPTLSPRSRYRPWLPGCLPLWRQYHSTSVAQKGKCEEEVWSQRPLDRRQERR